ncbi:hypothetical protein BDFB_003436, partial [Asbolus verrucosus]
TQDLFIVLRKIFIDYGYHKVTKQINLVCLVFHSVAYLVQVVFILSHMNVELISRYSPMMGMTASGLVVMIVPLILEKDIWVLRKTLLLFAWSLDCAGKEVKLTIRKRSKQVNCFNIYVFIIFFSGTVIMMPFLGDQSELFLCIQTFKYYFGFWSTVPYWLYFGTLPFVVYSSIRHAYVLFYGMLLTRQQITLINEHLERISEDLDEDTETYQVEIGKRLRFCIKQHIAVKM